jgi:AcrR family transcriptional regulator
VEDDARRFREAIIAASLELGQSFGEEAVTMRGIASKLGTSPTALYTCFDSKASIMRELRLRGTREMLRALAMGFELSDPRASLVEVSRRYIRWALDNPWLYRLLMEIDAPNNEVLQGETEFAEQQARLQQLVVAKYGGVIGRPIEELPKFLARWWSSLHGFCSLALGRRLGPHQQVLPIADLDAYVDEYVEDLVGGLLRARAPAPG